MRSEAASASRLRLVQLDQLILTLDDQLTAAVEVATLRDPALADPGQPGGEQRRLGTASPASRIASRSQ